MKKYYSANILFTSIITLLMTSTVLFLVKDKFLVQEEIGIDQNQTYLTDKFHLVETLKEKPTELCLENKQEYVRQTIGKITYQVQCELVVLFRDQNRLPKKKYIPYEKLNGVLNLAPYAEYIYHINNLSELPDSSEENPKIVMVHQEINEPLIQHFYGILITEHPFKFTQHKIYGLFISPYKEDSDYRNISYKKSVIEHLNQQFVQWRYRPNSRNILTNASSESF